MLSRAEAAGRLPEGGWRELREEVLERPPSASGMNKTLTDRYGPPAPAPTPPEGERLARLAAAARRLAEACREEPELPGALARRAADLAGEIEALLDG